MEKGSGALLEEFEDSYARYSYLYDLVEESALNEQPDSLRNKLVFYYGHTVACTRSKLIQAGVNLKPHRYDQLLERGVSPDAAEDIALQFWPSKHQIDEYKASFYNDIQALFGSGEFEDFQKGYALKLSIEHENLHYQTSFPLITKLDSSKKKGGDHVIFNSNVFPLEMEWVNVESGQVEYGGGTFRESISDFGWDNEQGNVCESISGFEVSKYPIINSQVLEFIKAGGYQDRSLWNDFSGGMEWLDNFGKLRGAPFQFVESKGSYGFKTLTDTLEFVPLGWPAMLNRFEAAAMARFFGGRMITESEWVYLHQGKNVKTCHESKYQPIDVKDFGVHEIGNIACWTSTDFKPLCSEDEFKVSDFYPDFSSEWFNEKHSVIRGSSFMSNGSMLNFNFRDFMQNVMDYTASTYVVKSNV